MKTSSKLPKRNNANSGKKAHNENQFIKIGRVRLHSWMNEKLPAADILISSFLLSAEHAKPIVIWSNAQ